MGNTSKASRKLLIIDDEPQICRIFEMILSSISDYIKTANDGREGFQLATRETFDLIIMDLKMPDWNGLEAIEGIQLVRPNTKFLVITGYLDKTIINKVESIPSVLSVVKKPIDSEDLLKHVNQYFEKE